MIVSGGEVVDGVVASDAWDEQGAVVRHLMEPRVLKQPERRYPRVLARTICQQGRCIAPPFKLVSSGVVGMDFNVVGAVLSIIEPVEQPVSNMLEYRVHHHNAHHERHQTPRCVRRVAHVSKELGRDEIRGRRDA